MAACILMAACTPGANSGAALIASQQEQFSAAHPALDRQACLKIACIYAANSSANTITIYPSTRNGHPHPIGTIGGSLTGLDMPFGIAVGAQHRIYVANLSANSVTVFGPDANGNVKPVQRIAGSNTTLKNPSALAVNAAGQMYVVNDDQSSVAVFRSDATGNVAPLRTIGGSHSGLNMVAGIAVDAQRNIYVANSQGGPPCGGMGSLPGGNIDVFAPNANGDVAPVRTISGQQAAFCGASALAVDPSGQMFVTNFFDPNSMYLGSINVYPAGSNGNVAPTQHIAGLNTLLSAPNAIAVDANDNIYVTNCSTCNISYLSVFGAGSDGNVRPTQLIRGRRGGFSRPLGIAVR